ncbi:MAG: hypothetical protein ACRCZB_06535, partial [Bacteroidales bacterium]
NQDFLSGLRLGISIHTPTFLSMTDSYATALRTSFVNFDTSLVRRSPSFDYRIQTPLNIMTGIAYTFGEQGSSWRSILSFDYEYTDYSSIKMRNERSLKDDFTEANEAIQTYYKNVSNLRFGGEVNYENIALRAGFAYYGNPYTKDIEKNGTIYTYSAGAGYRGKFAFFDFAYSISSQKDNAYMYHGYTMHSEKIFYNILQSNFILTFGLRF